MGLPRESRRYRLWVWAVGLVAALFLRALGATWRVRITGGDPFAVGTPFVAATWHRGLLVAAHSWRGRDIVVPVSRSRDGDLIDAVLRRLGFAASPRGSSSRGATALLRSLIRGLGSGKVVGLLPDGPRGPSGRAKPGALALARIAGVPLVPVGISATPCKRFGSWDRTMLPLPFARVHCHYGKPIAVPKKATAEEIETLRLELEATLHSLNEDLARDLAGPRRPAFVKGSKRRHE